MALPVAGLLFYSKPLERLLYPWLVASQAVPVFAIAPLLVLWFGLGLGPKVATVALIAFFPIVVSAVDGLRGVDPDLVRLFRAMEASEWQTFRKLRLPAALPQLLSGLKIGAAVGPIGAVFGEWISSTAGLGYVMFVANAQLNLEKLFAALMGLAVLGLGLFGSVSLLERILLRWRWTG
jgi:ABC-type nitrate/sulfonate/bicarbonate transport system permease component